MKNRLTGALALLVIAAGCILYSFGFAENVLIKLGVLSDTETPSVVTHISWDEKYPFSAEYAEE